MSSSPRPSDASRSARSKPRLMDTETDGCGPSVGSSVCCMESLAGISNSTLRSSSALPRALMLAPSLLASISPVRRGARESWLTRRPSRETLPLNCGSYSPKADGV